MISRLDQIKSSINKKFKDEVLGFGKQYTKIDRIPFSSPRLNYLTRGGIPWPGVTELSGGEGAGKSTLLGDLTKNAQQMGMLCALIDAENKGDLEYWEFLGVDIDNLLVCRPQNASGEDILQMCLELLKEGIQFLGIDSVASLVPQSVLTNEMSDKTYAGSSGILSTFSQKLSGQGIIQLNNACLVGVNQVRDNIGGYGLRTVGGHFWKHLCVYRLQISRGNPFDEVYKELPMGTPDDISGYTMEARVLKNQFCPNDRRFAQCTFHNYHGIDVVVDAAEVAMTYGFLIRAGAWYRLVDQETGEILNFNGEEFKVNGRNALFESFRKNPLIFNWVLDKIKELMTAEYESINKLPEKEVNEDAETESGDVSEEL